MRVSVLVVEVAGKGGVGSHRRGKLLGVRMGFAVNLVEEWREVSLLHGVMVLRLLFSWALGCISSVSWLRGLMSVTRE